MAMKWASPSARATCVAAALSMSTSLAPKNSRNSGEGVARHAGSPGKSRALFQHGLDVLRTCPSDGDLPGEHHPAGAERGAEERYLRPATVPGFVSKVYPGVIGPGAGL